MPSGPKTRIAIIIPLAIGFALAGCAAPREESAAETSLERAQAWFRARLAAEGQRERPWGADETELSGEDRKLIDDVLQERRFRSRWHIYEEDGRRIALITKAVGGWNYNQFELWVFVDRGDGWEFELVRHLGMSRYGSYGGGKVHITAIRGLDPQAEDPFASLELIDVENIPLFPETAERQDAP